MTREQIEKVAGVAVFTTCLYAKDDVEGFSGQDVLDICEEYKRQFIKAAAESSSKEEG